MRTNTFQHAHILVVDDEETNLRLMRKFLQHAGYHSIVTLQDATRFEEEIAARPPDLVLLDLRMPGRDGLAVLKALHDKIAHEHLPVLVVTGDVSVDARRAALTLGRSISSSSPFASATSSRCGSCTPTCTSSSKKRGSR